MNIVSVLCAARNSVYKGMQDVDVFDIQRDARSFCGETSVVCHPPCRSWSAYCSHQAKPMPGEKDLGPWCVEQVKRCGGVLEHPAHSRLWDHCGLPRVGDPERDGMFSMWLEQSWFGDTRTKNTWLFLVGVDREKLTIPFRLHNPNGDRRRWQCMSKNQRAATSFEMAEWLVSAARTVNS